METKLKNQIKILTIFFIIALIISGITAFPIETELKYLLNFVDYFPNEMKSWLIKTFTAMSEINKKYPMLAYGYDWLAFAHIIIAIAFWGVFKDPVRNIWIVEFGMITCTLILPLAFICGPIRGIPLFWQLIDCSFGLFGIIPLNILRNKILKLETQLKGEIRK
jgi:hypothetical protein